MQLVHEMPAGGRSVNAPVRTTRDRSNYLVKSRERESSFPTPFPLAQTPAHVDHSRRTCIFSTRGDRIIASVSSPPFLPLSPACQGRDASILQTFRDYVCTQRRRGKPIDHVGVRELFTFCDAARSRRIALAEKFRGILGSWVSGRPPSRFGYRCIACLESSSERSNSLNKE